MSVVEKEIVELDREGRQELVRAYIRTTLSLAVLLVSAGTIYWVNAWVYAVVNTLLAFGFGRLMVRSNPQMLNARGKRPKGVKRFDTVILALMAPAILLSLVTAGLDAVRYGWTTMPLWLNALGLVLYIGGVLLSFWAMAVNEYFEKTVRIQHERDHRVCMDGPYRFVRHPGYSGIIVMTLTVPLLLGSWWALVPGAVVVVLFVVRTAFEDRMLRSELPGYADYSQKTEYRLVPRVW